MTVTIYPVPHQLLTNPYLDQLYAPFDAWPDVMIRRVPFVQAIRELLRGSGPRIAHWHFFDELTQRPSWLMTAARTLAFIGLIKLLRWRGVGLVWTAHNIEPHELRHPRWAARAYRAMLHTADAIIAHGAAAADLVRQRYGDAPITVIPQGAYVGLYGPRRDRTASREALGLPADQFVALNIGMIRPYKGLELLIDAWRGVDGTLLIAGGVKDPAYADVLRQQAAASANVQLHLNFVPNEQLPTWFAAADVLVLPYRKLLTSAILLWALSYGVPVIAPDVPPVRELIDEGVEGFVFVPNDVEDLHAAIQRAADHPNLAVVGEAAYQRALPFDWPSIAARTAEVYRGVGDSR